MAINFPSNLDSFTNPTSSNTLNSPDHAVQHSNSNDAIVALETKVGVDGSAVTTSLDYKLSGVTGTDKAVSKTGVETLTNKTLTSPAVNIGSDATGDLYTRGSGGALQRVAVGSTGQVLGVSAGLPAYVPNPAAALGSATVNGTFQEATTAQINAGTTTGSTGADLVVNPAALAASNYLNTTNILTTPIKFGGTGADGALTITSGTTTIDLANAAVVTKNYTSISITGTGALAFSNPNTNGTIIILKSQGNVTITSSANPTIDLRAIGGAASSSGNSYYAIPTAGSVNSGTSGGAGGTAITLMKSITNKTIPASTGAGGGAGSGSTGGAGGGSLVIDCGGAYNFGASSTINASGANGTNATASGGGGGAGGSIIVIYNTLTANSGAYSLNGGTAGASSGGFSAGGGGGGANRVGGGVGGSSGGTGGAGSNDDGTGGASNGNAGGGGGAGGWKLITSNTEFI
jgi:hypothetical protein